MKHAIDPKVDCVFKALLGSEENSNLLIEFLNAMLGQQLAHPIKQVDILNPYNEREYLDDKLSIVDIKARDELENIFQVEIQLSVFPSLPARILYTWADIYSQQLKSGQNYRELKPTYSIWLLNGRLYEDENYLHYFKIQDDKGVSLVEHCHITVLELEKFHITTIEDNQQRWLQFFKEGETLDEKILPEWMDTHSMRQAMNTLKQFSEKDRQYFAYQARQDYLRQQSCIQEEREEAEQAKLQAEEERDEIKQVLNLARQEEQANIAEIQRLKALLNPSKS